MSVAFAAMADYTKAHELNPRAVEPGELEARHSNQAAVQNKPASVTTAARTRVRRTVTARLVRRRR